MTALCLVLLLAGQIVAFVALWRFAVDTEHGQTLDWIALSGNSIGQDRVAGLTGTVLNAMSVLSLLVATVVIGFIALIRSRIGLAVASMMLIAGANVTTQLLKHVIIRPDLGVDPERAAAGNSLPSGHTAVAASVAVALVLVLPRTVRAWGALIGAGYSALAGVATLSAGWHRPSDALAALLIVGAWAALAGLLLLLIQPPAAKVDPTDAHRRMAVVLGVGGLLLLVAAAVAVQRTENVLDVPVEDLGRRELLIAYGGSALGITGMASLLLATVLATVHRVVPSEPG